MSLSKKIVLSPFTIFGIGNIGDEAMLQGFAHLASPYKNNYKFSLSAYDLAHAHKIEPSMSYYKNGFWDLPLRMQVRSAQISLIVGDTPITDVLHPWPLNALSKWIYILRSRPIGFIGVGIEQLLHPESKTIVRNKIAPLVKIWSTRSLKDKQRLEEYGVSAEKIIPAADLAWLVNPVDKSYGQRQLKALGVDFSYPLIGINVTNESFVFEKSPKFFDILAEFADRLISKYNATILLFSNDVREVEYVDKMANLRIMKRMKENKRIYFIPNKYYSPQEMLSLISNCRLTIASRYHFCLFSALQSVPFIAIKRQDKLNDLCLDLDWQFNTSLDDMDKDKFEQMFSQIDLDYDQLLKHLIYRKQLMKERAMKNSLALEIMLNSTIS
jgi:polysaccharide pyruvyl transferase WcaK-like protein